MATPTPKTIIEVLSNLYSEGYDQQTDFYGEAPISLALDQIEAIIKEAKPKNPCGGSDARFGFDWAIQQYSGELLDRLGKG